MSSLENAWNPERLLEEKSVLVVPGDQFGMDGWLRIGYGGEANEIERGLARIQEALDADNRQ